MVTRVKTANEVNVSDENIYYHMLDAYFSVYGLPDYLVEEVSFDTKKTQTLFEN